MASLPGGGGRGGGVGHNAPRPAPSPGRVAGESLVSPLENELGLDSGQVREVAVLKREALRLRRHLLELHQMLVSEEASAKYREATMASESMVTVLRGVLTKPQLQKLDLFMEVNGARVDDDLRRMLADDSELRHEVLGGDGEDPDAPSAMLARMRGRGAGGAEGGGGAGEEEFEEGRAI